MPKLSVFHDKVSDFKATISGEVITGKYHENVWTAEFVDQIDLFSDARQGSEMLAQGLVEWDLTDDADKAIPLDSESLYKLVPITIQRAILSAILAAQAPGKPSGRSSRGSF